jgi:hypothetical protein
MCFPLYGVLLGHLCEWLSIFCFFEEFAKDIDGFLLAFGCGGSLSSMKIPPDPLENQLQRASASGCVMRVSYYNSLVVASILQVLYQLLRVRARHHFILPTINKNCGNAAIPGALPQVDLEWIERVRGKRFLQDFYCWGNEQLGNAHRLAPVELTD